MSPSWILSGWNRQDIEKVNFVKKYIKSSYKPRRKIFFKNRNVGKSQNHEIHKVINTNASKQIKNKLNPTLFNEKQIIATKKYIIFIYQKGIHSWKDDNI